MKLLLDTHAFIWWDSEQTRLSGKALAVCLDPANSLHLSLASLWELQIKMQLGKLTLRFSLENILDDQRRNGLSIEEIRIEDILGLSHLPTFHRDPFDRLLIAQAQCNAFHLVSHDTQIARYDVAILW